MTVGKWRKRYRDLGLEDLHDEIRPGRPRTDEDDKVAEVINRALQSNPADGRTQWTARSMAAATGISTSTSHRWLQTFSLQPHRHKSFNLSNAPFFVKKGRDVVRLYRSSALTRNADPGLRLHPAAVADGSGLRRGCHPPHDPPRHGHTVCRLGHGHRLVIAECKPRNRRQEFLSSYGTVKVNRK